jgi:hypothetical protein
MNRDKIFSGPGLLIAYHTREQALEGIVIAIGEALDELP